MNEIFKAIEQLQEQKLLQLHTIFLAEILAVNFENQTATVKPLTLNKQIGKEAIERSVLTNIPIANQARFKFYLCEELREDEDIPKPQCEESICEVCGERERREIRVEKIKSGDIAICAACERNISQAKKGISAVPPIGHHEIKDSIVIATL